jgi:bifunctional non-homologous end joining protein LigD
VSPELVITHPEKVLFPDDGITKGELAAYYESVAPIMVPHIRARPITMERYPAGIGQKGFMHKDVSKGFPAWLERVEVPKKDGTVHHPIVTDTRSLLWIANQNCITPHVWSSRAPDLSHPDICVFDLDPSVDDAKKLAAAALGLRDVLEELGLPSWVKTSGSKGFHIVVPLDKKSGMGEVSGFAHAVGSLLVARHPKDLTQEFSKADRGTAFVDTGRNGYSATWAAAYAVRAKPGAPVSAPCTWQEVEGGTVGPRTFTLRTMARRVAEVGDLWSDLRKRGRSLMRPIARLRRAINPIADPTVRISKPPQLRIEAGRRRCQRLSVLRHDKLPSLQSCHPLSSPPRG